MNNAAQVIQNSLQEGKQQPANMDEEMALDDPNDQRCDIP